MNHHLYIIGGDFEYSTRLVSYLNSKDGFPFTVRYVNPKHINDVDIEKAALLIVDERDYECVKGSIIQDNVIVLSETTNYEINGIRYISKYRNCEVILKDILRYSADMESLESFINRRSTLKIYGFYSPVKSCGQSTLCRELGKELSKRASTLYLCLEAYSGLETITGKKYEKNIGDLIYGLESGRSNMGAVLGSIVENIDGVDTIPPMKGHDEIISINCWSSIISTVETYSDYEYLLIDISDAVSDLGSLLSLCNRVITIEKDDICSEGKLADYEEILQKRGYEEIIHKTIRWKISQDRTNARLLMNSLITGD